MSVLVLIAIAFFAAALYLVVTGALLGAVLAAFIGLLLLAASQGKLTR